MVQQVKGSVTADLEADTTTEINTSVANMDSDILDGTFSPTAPTEVWTGSATQVDISSLSEGGSGWYVVDTSTGPKGTLYVADPANDFVSVAVDYDIGATFYAITFVRYSQTVGFTAVTVNLTDLDTTPATSTTDLTIESISKV